MRSSSRTTLNLGLAALCACSSAGGGQAKVAAPAGANPYAEGEVVAFDVADDLGNAVGVVHTTIKRSQAGLRVTTRVAKGGQVVEHVLQARGDLSPVMYRRMTSDHQRLTLQFTDERVRVLDAKGTRDMAGARVTSPLIPDSDLVTLALALARAAPEAGNSVDMMVYDPEQVRSRKWKVNAYLDGQGRRVVDVPGGQVTFDAKGEVVRYTRQNGQVLTPKVPPGDAPSMAMQAKPLVYRRPKLAGWTDRPVEVAVDGGVLGGVVSIPSERGRYEGGRVPGLVFISDRGAQDRHGFAGAIDVGTWRLFDYLAERGVVVARIDDRGTGASSAAPLDGADAPAAAVADAQAIIAQLRQYPEVDGDRIYVMGHGYGAHVAAALPEKEKLGGLLLVAMPLAAAPPDTATRLSQVNLPVAVFQGLKDFEASWKTDAKGTMTALKKSKARPHHKLFAYDRLDHHMKPQNGKSTPESYADRDRLVSDEFVRDVHAFISRPAK